MRSSFWKNETFVSEIFTHFFNSVQLNFQDYEKLRLLLPTEVFILVNNYRFNKTLYFFIFSSIILMLLSLFYFSKCSSIYLNWFLNYRYSNHRHTTVSSNRRRALVVMRATCRAAISIGRRYGARARKSNALSRAI